MPDELSIKFSLDRQQALRGESIFFAVAIQNISGRVLQDLPTLYRQNEALVLTLVDPAGKSQKSTQKTPARRQGLYSHGPDQTKTGPLGPNQKLELKEDLLGWFGELSPGTYSISAAYKSGAVVDLESAPVTFRILPITPVALDTPRIGQCAAQAPLAGALLHKFPPADPNNGSYQLFYQQQSFNLPRAPLHMIRAAMVAEPVHALAASICNPSAPRGHVIWLDRDQLLMAGVDLTTFKPVPPVPVKAPFAGAPLRSPLSHGDGTLLVPYADAVARRCVLLAVAPDGTCETVELPLEKHAPLGASAWIWDYDTRLHAAWATPGGREVAYRKLPLDDRKAGFSSPTVISLDHKVLWMDGFVDSDAPRTRTLPGEELPPHDAVAWVVLERGAQLVCTRLNLTHPLPQYIWSFGNDEIGPLTVLDSAVTRRQQLVLLVKDAKSKLYYASTTTRQFLPILEVARADLKEAQFPSLLVAGNDGVAPWVYIRYIDAVNQRIAWVKTEPASENDPLESGAVPAPARP